MEWNDNAKPGEQFIMVEPLNRRIPKGSIVTLHVNDGTFNPYFKYEGGTYAISWLRLEPFEVNPFEQLNLIS